MSDRRLLTIQQACDYLSVSEVTFRRMVGRGDMPKPIMLTPRTPRWDKEAIDKIITGGSDA